MERTRLKGGSLSGTYECAEGSARFIRKEISLTENREFGFYRWFSQLKKLQRLGARFPGMFPRVINIGTESGAAGGAAYFDLEFIEGAVSCYQFLKGNPPRAEVEALFQSIVKTMDALHAQKIESFKGGIDLYIDQEVKRALDVCMDEPAFREFAAHPVIVFQGKEVRPLARRIDEFYALAHAHYTKPEECFTHGNITLENILYVPAERRVVLIDLYEENYIDTVHNEYSQILQSCNSYYEVYNELPVVVRGNAVSIAAPRYEGIDAFNTLFHEFLRARLTPDDMIVTKLYEVSQFTRMLPFKKHVAKDKMTFFYALASARFDELAGAQA